MYFIGYDIGSSSIKAALLDGETNRQLAVSHFPETELDISSPQTGFAEQNPELWWECVLQATRAVIAKAGVDASKVKGIGISYQMHGLVMVDKDLRVIRPSIIWCDSRAVSVGDELLQIIGEERSNEHMLNAPGNFTAAKLKWVKDNEPELFAKVHKIMLPGDYVAMRLTGLCTTTVSGLSEGIFWDFKNEELSKPLMEACGFDESVISDIVPTFGEQGSLTAEAADTLGLTEGIQVAYRAGDQPNNALSLGVFNPGEIAATGGTSGVVYGVQGEPVYDPKSRVNSFAHVNHTSSDPRIGVLLCINGSGIQYRYIRQMMAKDNVNYDDMEALGSQVAIGSDGLRILPFGNGAERMLSNQDPGASMVGIQFNRHRAEHFYRASLEGIAFSFMYGMEVMQELGMDINKLRVGNDNLFQSKIFSTTIASLSGAPIEMVETTGAIGAARGAAYGLGYFKTLGEAVAGDTILRVYKPAQGNYQQAYQIWKNDLQRILNK
ncbi:MAG: carbohydrate kinase [Flammeovirgaceae bacterium]|nr:carbohydrate kinase [Flammeovirgaceae bacterium]MBE60991.1 carbohydrate kinase [Flammeovirgaceae bacterium]HCX20647.1 carbohydrate kinase [Cytophagales bacterium]|tara:strand:+ start:753 stop:2234 length:1482 start_codon:yes stop_codon:yes gene_type:complete